MFAPAFFRCLAALLLALLPAAAAAAVPAPTRTGRLQVEVRPDHADWTYKLGERATFTVRVTRDGHPVSGLKLHYRLGLENMPPSHEGDAELPPEGLALESEPVNSPGFLACAVEVNHEGETYRGRAAAGFAPEAIEPTVKDPEDFDAFWAEGKRVLAGIALDARVERMPERSTSEVDCHHVSLASAPGGPPSTSGTVPPASRLYGVLCEPVGPGPFPAVLQVPGAGVRSYQGARDLAARGLITFQIGIHGVPVNLPDEVYQSLATGALTSYPLINSEDRDRHYYRRVYLGVVRANDFLTTRPRWDRHNLGVMGGSQGGALAIVTAALDPRVRALVAYYPALSDHTGFLHGRTGGWPFMLRPEAARTEARLHTLAYFDVVNFARRVKVPGFYSWGFNDTTCPPTSMYAAYNVIGAPKQLLLALETGHGTIPEQTHKSDAWLLERLSVSKAGKRPGKPGKPVRGVAAGAAGPQ